MDLGRLIHQGSAQHFPKLGRVGMPMLFNCMTGGQRKDLVFGTANRDAAIPLAWHAAAIDHLPGCGHMNLAVDAIRTRVHWWARRMVTSIARGFVQRKQSMLPPCTLVLLVSPAPAQQPAVLDSVSRYVTAELARQQIPGASVTILRGDSVLLSRGFGLANIELRVPASDSTIYQSGSMGKQFTSSGILMLAEQGRLRLDDRITRWLTEGAGVWDSVTVRHLLTHTGGVAEYTDSTFDYRRDYTEEQLVRFAASRPLNFRPGERWSYSNTGYLLLGVLIHRVTGRFYGDVLRQMIFAPAGMRTTRIISEADIVPNRAAGYQLVRNRVENQEWVSPSLNTTADGALYFTVRDLARWAVSLNHRRIPSASALEKAWTPVTLNDGGSFPYGFGWDLTQQRGHSRIGHTGAWQGFETALYRYPEYDLTIAMLTNLAQARPGAIVQGIAGILHPELLPPHLIPHRLAVAPPVAVQDVIRQIAAAGAGPNLDTGLRRFLSPGFRERLAGLLAQAPSWLPLGCDLVKGQQITWLGGRVNRVCYARMTGKDADIAFSVFFTADGRATYVDYYDY
jgi:CubicO group peptidase (beta-lactamase class C family)